MPQTPGCLLNLLCSVTVLRNTGPSILWADLDLVCLIFSCSPSSSKKEKNSMSEETEISDRTVGKELFFFFLHYQVDGTVWGPDGKGAFTSKTRLFPFGFCWKQRRSPGRLRARPSLQAVAPPAAILFRGPPERGIVQCSVGLRPAQVLC